MQKKKDHWAMFCKGNKGEIQKFSKTAWTKTTKSDLKKVLIGQYSAVILIQATYMEIIIIIIVSYWQNTCLPVYPVVCACIPWHWCPAHSQVDVGEMESWNPKSGYFCDRWSQKFCPQTQIKRSV